ncbi:uncharacterized protein DNG_05693 [Cephalotrichum gorgonifer]|uniref:Spp2/MOS2 G-patch domain-containing protein n=1 Tax=Cephalotrichum gorgonifer TaxID=2041049 RepID=A0AAE8N1D2_9PEZI|nr:uncharacterized protein DNG_05693 [Cephalotrichum gorgonifer]
MDPPSDAPPKAPRMSIKFNAPKPNGAAKPSSLGKRSRPHALGGSSDSESDHYSDHSDGGRGGRRSAFDSGSRRDGRSDRDGRRRDRDGRRSPGAGRTLEIGDVPKIIRPPEASRRPKMRSRVVDGRSGDGVTKEVEPADADKQMVWGLNLSKKRSPPPSRQSPASAEKTEQDETKPKGPPKTVDEQAMDRLLGKSSPGADKVITLSERDAYARDVDSAPPPDDVNLETGIDVTEFGAAMLRGMGWDGEYSRPGFKQVERRANQLGLGAKELKGKEDLGGWDHKGKGSGGDRPKRLADYRREKEKERESRESRRTGGRDSYKRERERERERDRDRRYDRGDDRRRY